MDTLDLELRILDFVARPNYQPVKPRVIADRLNLSKDEAREAKRVVKRLVRRGQLAYGANHMVKPAEPESPKSGRVVGTFQRMQAGFGFVRLHDPVTGAPFSRGQQAEPPEDIYIPAKWTADAASGDVVLTQLNRQRSGDPGPRGEIIEVIDRQTQQFVGTYFEETGVGYVWVDGRLFAQPIAVGDPGAKNAQPDDKVVFEMVRFPSSTREGEGVVTEVLGPRGKPGVDTLSIMREFSLPDQFAEDALDEARDQALQFDETDLADRTDFTGETIVTIDPVDARDFDDAISLEKLDNGHWRLGVHIADVVHFVRPNTALDREARDRATSVYLPDRVLPMLPEIISNSLASLQPHKVRYTKSVVMEFTPEGVRTHAECHNAAIKSSRRLTYEEVDEFLAGPEAMQRRWGAKVCGLLSRMHELAMTLRHRRRDRGALELHMPELKVDLDKDGRVTGAHVAPNTESHQIIEEFMLAANEAVAEQLFEREIFFLRRIHQAPAPRKLKVLTEFVRELGFEVISLESRFELQRLLDMATGRPEQHAVHYATLRSMQRAVYGPEEEGHFGLASDCYCHFTSPIRRYPDLTIHRLFDAILTDRKPINDYDALVLLGQHCSDREQRAESAERELTKLKLLSYLSTRIGEKMTAVVTGVESFGLFVQGIELPAEGLVHVESLTDDFYHFDRRSHTLAGHRSGNQYRLGDVLEVAVARVDLERRELDFRLAARKPVSRRKPAAEPARKSKQRGKGPKRGPAKGSGKRNRKK